MQSMQSIAPLIIATAVYLATTVLACAAEPQRFYPDDLQQDGRVTLYPAFSPDGRTLYIVQSGARRSGSIRNSSRAAKGRRTAGARLSPDGDLLFTSDRAYDGQPRGLLQI